MADFFGNSGNNTLDGTDDDDRIYGRSGNDTLNGGGGNDILVGGSGRDVLNGGSGNDQLFGGSGRDTLNGGTGSDLLSGDAGDDQLEGGGGNDVLLGGSGDDDLAGDAGSDLLLGGSGDDLLDGGSGSDILDGGSGDNIVTTGSGNDTVRISDPDGSTVITDFDPTQDTLDLRALTGVASLGDLSIVQSGDAVIITGDGFAGSVTIEGVTVDDMTSPGVVAVACFMTGTAIRTDRGDIPVEALSIGDRVVTAGGRVRPVRWIGRRAFSRRFAKSSPRIVPVRIRAGALGDGVPNQDLLVSPEHALMIDGVFVPAVHLVNDGTIRRDPDHAIFAYHHVELDGHDVIIANGAPAESYIDQGARRMFANWAEFEALYGPEPAGAEAGARALPTVTDGDHLDAIRARIAARSEGRRAA